MHHTKTSAPAGVFCVSGIAYSGLALSGADAPALPKGEPLAKPGTLRGLPKAPTLRKDFPRPGEVFPLRGSFIRADRKIPKSAPFGGAGCDHREQTERVVAVGDWGSSPPATQKTSAGADVFVWCIIFYNFPHCLPVKKRRVVVARNTLPARSTVVGNSGWEGLQG